MTVIDLFIFTIYEFPLILILDEKKVKFVSQEFACLENSLHF